MAGLLDDSSSFLNSPGGMGLLSAVAAGLAGARRRQPVNTLGAGLLGGLQAYAQTKEANDKDALQKVQLDDIKAQAGLRDAQLTQLKRQQAYLDQLMGGQSSMPAAQNALSAGAAIGDQQGGFDPQGGYSPPVKNVGPTLANAARMSAQPGGPVSAQTMGIPSQALAADMALNGGKSIPEWMFKRGTPDIQVTNGYAYDKNKVNPGFLPGLNISQNGQAALTTIGPDGMPIISLPRGAATTQAANVVAQELPKALIGSGFKREDFANPDGTTRSVTGLQFARDAGGIGDLMNMLGRMDGTAPVGAPMPTQTAPMPSQPAPRASADPSMVVPPKVQSARDVDRIAILQAELKQTTNPDDQAAIKRELFRMGAGPGTKLPPPSAAPAAGGGVVSGMNTQQAADAAAKKASATKQAEADVTPIETRRNSIAQLNQVLSTIDNVASHPGLAQGTGLSGTLDPRNYIPGTTAKDFHIAASQLSGQAFLSAYNQLRGAGQISNAEGGKAEDAMARLSTAQTTESYKKALGDFRAVIVGALERAKLAMPAGQDTQFPGDMKPNDIAAAAAAELARRKGK